MTTTTTNAAQEMARMIEGEEEYDEKERFEKQRETMTLDMFDAYATKAEMIRWNEKRAKTEVLYALLFEFVACNMRKDLIPLASSVVNTYLDDDYCNLDVLVFGGSTNKGRKRPTPRPPSNAVGRSGNEKRITHDATSQYYIQETFSVVTHMDICSADGTEDECTIYQKFLFLVLMGKEAEVQKRVFDLQMEHDFESLEEKDDVLDRMERLFKKLPELTDNLTLQPFNTHTSTKIILNYINECAFIYERLV